MMTMGKPLVLFVDDRADEGPLMRIVFARAGFVEPLRFAPGEERYSK